MKKRFILNFYLAITISFNLIDNILGGKNGTESW